MSANNLLELVHQGFRVSVGAAASLVESLQNPRQLEEPMSKLSDLVSNPQKLDENLSKLQGELRERTQEWAEKGEVTEKAAFKIIADITQQEKPAGNTPPSTASSPATSPNIYLHREIQELTGQIIALRTDLERLRQTEE